MNIYIDESGIFANPSGKDRAVSCVAALVIPEKYQKYVFKRFKRLKKSWGLDSDEPKGSKLNEEEIARVVSILCDYDNLVIACGIDIGAHTDAQITAHRENQAANLTKHVTSEHNPNLVRQIEEIQKRFLKIPNQLYAQSVLLTVLVQSVVKVSTLYYCQRNPCTLSDFRWVIDAKAPKLTDYEDLWSTVVMPFCEADSLSNPLPFLPGADYSFFDRSYALDIKTAPEHLQPFRRKDRQNEPFQAFDAKKVLSGNRSFRSSKEEIGLQLVDIVVNTIRRALHDNLEVNGWGNLGRLMVRPGKGKNAMQMLALSQDAIARPMQYGEIIEHFDNLSKPIIDQRFFQKIERQYDSL